MLSLALIAMATSASPPHDIVGAWTCAPYEIRNAEMSATVTSRYDYRPDGHYVSSSSAEYLFGETRVLIESSYRGRWTLDGSSLRLVTDELDITKVHPAIFSPSEGEAFLRNGSSLGTWHDYRVVQSSPRLVSERVDRPEWLVTEQCSCAPVAR